MAANMSATNEIPNGAGHPPKCNARISPPLVRISRAMAIARLVAVAATQIRACGIERPQNNRQTAAASIGMSTGSAISMACDPWRSWFRDRRCRRLRMWP